MLVAPDGTKLSKRKHGPVVSVTTYRDAGFLPQAFVNFLCLLGWSPKNDREFMPLDELRDAFTLEAVNRSNAVINFSDEDPFDPKAVWLNAEYIRALPVDELSQQLAPFFMQAGFDTTPEKTLAITPLIRERIKLLARSRLLRRFLFSEGASSIRPSRADSVQGRRCWLWPAASSSTLSRVLPAVTFDHDSLDQALRAAAAELGLKAGQAFQPIRVAVCGRKNAPPLFETMAVLGRDVCLTRLRGAEASLQSLA